MDETYDPLTTLRFIRAVCWPPDYATNQINGLLVLRLNRQPRERRRTSGGSRWNKLAALEAMRV